MKSSYLIILAYLLLFLFCGCKRTGESIEISPEKTIVTGKIINREVYPDYKTVTINVPDFRGEGIAYVDTIKEDGTFRIELDLFITQDLTFSPIVSSFLARPGDSIYIDIDFKNIGYVDFSGDFAKANRDYHKYVNSYYALDYYRNNRNPIDDLSYLKFCDSVRLAMHAKRTEYMKEVNPDKEVVEWTSKSLDIQYSIVLMDYVLRNLHQNHLREEKWVIPGEYVSMMNNIGNFFSGNMITSNTYHLVHLLLVKNSWRHLHDSTLNYEEMTHVMLKEIAETYSNDMLRQLLIGGLFQRDLAFNSINFIENNSDYLKTHITLPFISKPLAMQHAHVKHQIENPEIRHNKILSLLGDTPGRVLFDSVITAHKGKVIYFDFWATWCGPCIEALPRANKMIQHFEGENIEFVFLCMGVEKNKWKNTLSSLDMQGSHYFIEKREENNTLMRGFQIRGIPFYALVNQEGYIIDTGNYLNPMLPLTLDKINYLLKKEL
jgi:thiol-disulfide isomerase/thioredoxin